MPNPNHMNQQGDLESDRGRPSSIDGGVGGSMPPSLTQTPVTRDAPASEAVLLPPSRPGGLRLNECLARKEQRAMEMKLQLVRDNLKPICFQLHTSMDLGKHRKILKELGLWDFVRLGFDTNIRFDLLVQLIGNFSPDEHCSNVNGSRIDINPASLASALKLPMKRSLSQFHATMWSGETMVFVESLLCNWVLLHDEAWKMPREVAELTKPIKEGHPERVDWAGLVWFMVKEELMQGPLLGSCYYASHLQRLIKHQNPSVFGEDEDSIERAPSKKYGEVVVIDIEDGDEEVVVAQKYDVSEKPNEEEADLYTMSKEGELGGQAFVTGDCFQQSVSLEIDGLCFDFDEFDEFDDGNWLLSESSCTDNVAGLEELLSLSKFYTLSGPSSVDLIPELLEDSSQGTPTSSPGQCSTGKRKIDQENDISLRSHKILKVDGSSYLQPTVFTDRELLENAKIMLEAMEQKCSQMSMKQQFLMGELQQRECTIKHLQMTLCEEREKKQLEISELNRELWKMKNVLGDYRTALNEINTAFAKYR